MNDLNFLLKKMEEVFSLGWVPTTSGGSGGIGMTLEKLLNRETNSLPIADFGDIEIKTKRLSSESYITLFSVAPDSYLFETKRLYETYGYPHSKKPQYKAFNIAVYGNRFISLSRKYNLKVWVDRANKKVVLHIYDKKGVLIDDDSSWSFELLEERLMLKLKNLLLVKADRKFELGTVYYKYLYSTLYSIRGFNEFISAIENGTIRITFKLNVILSGPKTGQMRDHGTSFDILEKDLSAIYFKI